MEAKIYYTKIYNVVLSASRCESQAHVHLHGSCNDIFSVFPLEVEEQNNIVVIPIQLVGGEET